MTDANIFCCVIYATLSKERSLLDICEKNQAYAARWLVYSDTWLNYNVSLAPRAEADHCAWQVVTQHMFRKLPVQADDIFRTKIDVINEWLICFSKVRWISNKYWSVTGFNLVFYCMLQRVN